MINLLEILSFLCWLLIPFVVFAKLAYLEGFIKEISSQGWAKACALNLTRTMFFGLSMARLKGKMFCTLKYETMLLSFGLTTHV
jgi:hypothetical protein